MPWSATMGLHEEDLDALIAALKEIPPNPNLVPARTLAPAYQQKESP
jgi:hypothetical protein